jgi:hypothetical protein
LIVLNQIRCLFDFLWVTAVSRSIQKAIRSSWVPAPFMPLQIQHAPTRLDR